MMKKFQKRFNGVEFAHVCRQVIDIINLRKLTNRQFENSKQLSKTAYLGQKWSVFFREANPANRKSLLISPHSYSFLPIPTHWSVLRVRDKAGFSKNRIILKCMKDSILQSALSFRACDKPPGGAQDF